MDGVKAKGGSMFAASQQMNNPDGLMFTGTAVRAVAARVAASNVAKQQKQVADAELRRLAETTTAGRGAAGRGGRGRGGRGGPGGRIAGRPSSQIRPCSTKMRSPLYKRTFASSRPIARQGGEVEGHLLLMGSRTHSCC